MVPSPNSVLVYMCSASYTVHSPIAAAPCHEWTASLSHELMPFRQS